MSTPYLGEIRLFPYIRGAPDGWALCNGQLLAINVADALFSLIGTTYGGDGHTTFGMPDLRGRVPVHFGSGPGLRPYVPGQKGGSQTVTLLAASLPSHSHMLAASTSAGTETAPSDAFLAQSPEGTALYATSTAGLSPVAFPDATISDEGGNQPHENCMPTLAINFCIALQGLYPSRT